MPDFKISQLPVLTSANQDIADQLVVVDDSAAVTKSITREEFFKVVQSMGLTDGLTNLLLTLNFGEVGAGVGGGSGISGLEFDRGSLTNAQFVFDESDQKVKAGIIGALKILSTLTGTETLTNKTLTDPVLNGNLSTGTGVNVGALNPASATTLAVEKTIADYKTLKDSFTTSEADTGNTWVDAKTVYKKTVSFGALPDTTTKSVAHGITTLDTLISIDGVAENTSTNLRLPVPYINAGATSATELQVNNTNITVITSTNLAVYDKLFFTLYYTKV